LALGSGQDSGEEPVSETLDVSREEPGEITEAETGPEPVDETSGDALEFNDSGETPADPESLPPSRQEEKDLEDVVS
ncbi:MAG: hypothetical protein VX675_00455, partial [Planctomycetota bacterium]|nr:hypothetical protein [Planctomycetota bacterium]